jgi:imidazolonepropionase-like amidohydrolase
VLRSFIFITVLLPGALAALSQTLVFENVNVVPMDREQITGRQTVLVRNGRITEIGSAGKVRIGRLSFREPAWIS